MFRANIGSIEFGIRIAFFDTIIIKELASCLVFNLMPYVLVREITSCYSSCMDSPWSCSTLNLFSFVLAILSDVLNWVI
jgi:hypothetical protein